MKKQKYLPLLTEKEIEGIFNDGFLLEQKSFHIIEKDSLSYNQTRLRDNFFKEAQTIREAFLSGHTIIVKNLENYNKKIRLKCAELGREVDVHMYLVSEKGLSSFKFHKDDKNVLIHLIYGKKLFILKKPQNGNYSELQKAKNKTTDVQYLLKPGSELSISKGIFHRAIPKGASCLLSFGISTRPYYQIIGGLKSCDLKNSFSKEAHLSSEVDLDLIDSAHKEVLEITEANHPEAN